MDYDDRGCQVNGEKSYSGCLTSGVTQGSLLGSLLLLLSVYINDQDSRISNGIGKSAEDVAARHNTFNNNTLNRINLQVVQMAKEAYEYYYSIL